jgi:hypothetical protein
MICIEPCHPALALQGTIVDFPPIEIFTTFTISLTLLLQSS